MEKYSKQILNFLVIILIIIKSGWSKKLEAEHRLPSYFPQCYRNDPKLSECLLDASEKVRPFLRVGVPELKIPPFEPFMIPQIVLNQGSKSLNFKAVLQNTLVYGLTNYTFTRFDFDVPNLLFYCDLDLKNLLLKGKYNVTGHLLIANLEGKGDFTAAIDRGEIKLIQKYEKKMINGYEHIVPLYSNSSIEVSGPKAELEGLFDNNPQLRDATAKAINDNVNELFQEIKPVVVETLNRIMEDLLLKSISGYVPFDRLYPIK